MERRRTIRLMADKGLVSVGRRPPELTGAGWPLRDISEGGLRFAVPADEPGPDILRTLLPGEAVVVTVELGSGPAPKGTEGTEGTEGEGRDGTAAGSSGGAASTAARKPFLRLSATVRRVNKPARGEREVSIEFTALSRRDRERLRGIVLDLAVASIERSERGKRVSRRRASAPGRRLGDILVNRRAVSREDLERFLREDYDEQRPIGRQLVSRGLVDEPAAARALAEQASLRFVDLGAEGIDLLNIRQFGESYLARHLFLPLSVEGSSVTVAAAAPLSEDVLGDIQKQYGRPVRSVIASERQIVSAIQKAFHVSRNRRTKARIRAGLSVRFKLFDEGWRPLHRDALPGLTKNLSEGGMLFVGPEPEGVSIADLATDTVHVGVHLFLPNEDEPVRAPCELVRTVSLRDEHEGKRVLFLYGVRVLGVSDEDRRRLNLFRLMAYVSWSVTQQG